MRTITLPLVLSLVACAPEPGGTEVSSHNYEITQQRDARAASCSHAAIEAEVEETMTDLGLAVCNVAIGTPADGVQLIVSRRLTDFADPMDVPLFTPTPTFSWDTPMNAGSVSKMATAQAFLELWANNEVAFQYVPKDGDFVKEPLPLDDILLGDVLDLPDDWPFWISQVTAEELLSHTSGIEEKGDDNDCDPDCDDDEDMWFWYDDTDTAVFHREMTGSITDDEGLLDVSPGDLNTIANPGGHPRFAFRALVPPTSPDYNKVTATQGRYSNINYLLLGAIIDHVVTQPGFAGYGTGPYAPGGLSGLEPGFESWTWWVLSDHARTSEASLLTPALQHNFRVPTASIPGIPRSYQNDANVMIAMSQWDGAGFESPAGGWTMTIGDQLRLAMPLSTDGDLQRLHPLAASTYAKPVKAIDVGGDYGYGVQSFGMGGYDVKGHGGTIYGYSGGTYMIYPQGGASADKRFVSIACNTDPGELDAAGEYKSSTYYHAFATRIRDEWGSTSPTCPTLSKGKTIPKLTKAQTRIATTYWPSWDADALADIERYGHAAALALWESDLEDRSYGSKAMAAIEDEDYNKAAQCALLWAGDTAGKWTCR